MSKRLLNSVLKLVAFLVIIFITGCDSKTDRPTIGVILATSGPADFIGKPEKGVLKAMMEQYDNPYNIELKYLNSEGKLDMASAFFDSFAENDQVIAIIGPSTSGESIILAQEAYRKKIPLLSLGASKDILKLKDNQVNPWVFKFAQNDNLAAEKLVGVISQQSSTKVAFLYSNDGFGKSGSNVFKEEVEKTNIEVVHEAAFPSGLDAPETYVDAIPKDVQGIVIWGTAGSDTLVREIKLRDYKAKIYLSHGNASESFIKSAGTSAEGVILIGSRLLIDNAGLEENNPADNVIIRYQRLWRKEFEGAPSHFGGHARDALAALITVFPKVDFSQNLEQVRADVRLAIENTKTLYGVTGIFRFTSTDHAGLDLNAFEVYEIKNGKFGLYEK